MARAESTERGRLLVPRGRGRGQTPDMARCLAPGRGRNGLGAVEAALGVPGQGAAAAERAGDEAEAAEEELDGHGVRLDSPAACESFPLSATGRSL
jgi:hypothetical protein